MHRKTMRRISRSAIRHTHRVNFRTLWPAPDDLGDALAAFRRAICAHRRLARLAPQFFDSATVDRERSEREARRHHEALCEAALAKVYGCEPEPPRPHNNQPPLPSTRIQREIERHLAARELWMTAGSAAMQRHQQRRPHAIPSFSRVVRLLEIAMDFGHLASGLDSNHPSAGICADDSFWQDLDRAYGHVEQSHSSSLSSSKSEDTQKPEPVVTTDSAPALSAQARAPLQPPSATPISMTSPPPGQPRRDAWSSWARQLRRRNT